MILYGDDIDVDLLLLNIVFVRYILGTRKGRAMVMMLVQVDLRYLMLSSTTWRGFGVLW